MENKIEIFKELIVTKFYEEAKKWMLNNFISRIDVNSNEVKLDLMFEHFLITLIPTNEEREKWTEKYYNKDVM